VAATVARLVAVLARCATVFAIIGCHLVATVPSLLIALPRGRDEASAVLQRRARRLLASLGPSFVKGAQLLSTRHDVLPSRWCEALGRLYDQVPPMSQAQAERVLRRCYLDAQIDPSRVDWAGVASGSIACVYRAILGDGTEVAVKIRRPGVCARIRNDFAILIAGASLLQALPGFRRLPAAEMMRQVKAAVALQGDLELELQSLRALRDNLSDLPYLRIPEPVEELCRPEVLVMEYLPGLRQIDSTDEVAQLAERVLHCVYRMLFLDGLVHCDMHPGNLYLQPAGHVVLLDAGFVVRLNPRVRSLFAEFFLAMVRGDGRACAAIVHRSAARVSEDADLLAFTADMVKLIDGSTQRRAAEFSLINFATQLFRIQRRHGLFAAPEFIFPLLALLVLEGRINRLNATVDFQAAALPVLLKALRSGYVL
jgi:ubiquinone biosynthesis protein